ncbi:PREDICTED: angiopoietin-related protein 6 isoform X1 [Hipposideros armiger]|uniref:Angiopoietin-related protein 6 isoform X1 n=2 Tax=Hipposideros armiger TaxID=186990 RepID=A0A8B7SNJ4_HIPAR|nr:PREDICTED: angiopoietin-related protein 6 isoform X1 [Hipposideros armiger]
MSRGFESCLGQFCQRPGVHSGYEFRTEELGKEAASLQGLRTASPLSQLRGPCWNLGSSSDFCACCERHWIQGLGCERSAMWAPRLRTLHLLLLLGASWARAGAPRCTYTFVLPQQKFTGAVCWSGPAAAGPVREAVNASEVAALRVRVGRHEELLRELQRLAAADSAVAGDVRALRKESRGLSARLGQLRAQLQHEADPGAAPGPGAEPAAALALLGERVLNASAEAQRAAAHFHQLDVKFRELAQLVSQQSSLIARLERLCPGDSGGQQQVLPPPLVPVVPVSLVGGTNDTGRRLDPAPEPQSQQEPLASSMPTGYPAVPTKPAGPWQDCAEAHWAGHGQSGVYELRLGRHMVLAWCEQQLEGGGWTVIQRRQDGSVNFFTTWQHYKVGFGQPDGEYWLGLEPVHQLTSRGDHELLVLLEDWGGRGARAHYDAFSLEPERDHYRLRLGQYHGDAGDSLSWHNDKPFSTVDRDRDSYSGNCALYQRGGWWYHACAHSNLNGVWHRGGHYRSRYQDGVYWAEFRGGAYSLKKAAMLIRPLRL